MCSALLVLSMHAISILQILRDIESNEGNNVDITMLSMCYLYITDIA